MTGARVGAILTRAPSLMKGHGMFQGASNGEGATGELRIGAFYGYAMGAQEVSLGYAIPGIAELFSMYALDNFDKHGMKAGDSWNQFLAIPRVNAYINEAVRMNGGIR